MGSEFHATDIRYRRSVIGMIDSPIHFCMIVGVLDNLGLGHILICGIDIPVRKRQPTQDHSFQLTDGASLVIVFGNANFTAEIMG